MLSLCFGHHLRTGMRVTVRAQMLFDLNALISVNVNLDNIVQPFTKEEIDKVIKMIPADKASGLMVSMDTFSRSVGQLYI